MRLLLVFIAFCCVVSLAVEPRNLAVLDFTAGQASVSQEDLAGLTTRFEAELQSTQVFRVVERRNMTAILQEQGFQQSGACAESECQVKVGQLLGVDLIATGSFQQMDGIVSLTVKLVNVESGVVEKTHIIDIEGSLQDMTRAGCAEMALVIAGKKKPEGERQILTVKKTRIWPWVVGGVALVGAGVAAVVLLTQDDSKSEDRGTGNEYD